MTTYDWAQIDSEWQETDFGKEAAFWWFIAEKLITAKLKLPSRMWRSFRTSIRYKEAIVLSTAVRNFTFDLKPPFYMSVPLLLASV